VKSYKICSNQHEYESNHNGDQTKEIDGYVKDTHGKDEFLWNRNLVGNEKLHPNIRSFAQRIETNSKAPGDHWKLIKQTAGLMSLSSKNSNLESDSIVVSFAGK
ncbi:hypothetical protein Anas_04568, partial [Armadillidium nasatum]